MLQNAAGIVFVSLYVRMYITNTKNVYPINRKFHCNLLECSVMHNIHTECMEDNGNVLFLFIILAQWTTAQHEKVFRTLEIS
jgi:hypothetical protein